MEPTKVVSSLDFQEEVDAGAEQVNTAKGVNIGSIKLSTVSEQLSTGNEQVITVGAKKSTSSQEEASLAEAIRLDSLQKEEEAKQIHLDSLLAQRIAEEEELNEQQKKRKAQNQGTWKLSQLKNLSFEEVKKEFDKLVKQVESFAPIDFEATKASLKRFGEE
ncbi:hypothetical protein Tco_1288120, partial [Tanacetum coccineum]